MMPQNKAGQWTFKRIVQDGDNWERYQQVYERQVTLQQLAEVEMFNITHRHVTFTVPDVLWEVFEGQAEWRGMLFEAANATLRKVMKVEPGIVAVLHLYGKELKVNYPMHVWWRKGAWTTGGDGGRRGF